MQEEPETMLLTWPNKSFPLVRTARTMLALAALASLAIFVGATRPAPPRKVALPTMPRPTRTVDLALPALLPIPTGDTELLADARPAVAAFQPAIEPGRRTHIVRMEVTAYCACSKCCGPNAQGITASGLHVSYNHGKFVAADTDVLAMFTRVIVPGYDDQPVPVIDRGGAIKGYKLDLYFPTHDEALQWGRQMIDVTVVE